MILQLCKYDKNLDYWNFSKGIPLRMRIHLAWNILLGKDCSIRLSDDVEVTKHN